MSRPVKLVYASMLAEKVALASLQSLEVESNVLV